MEVRATRIPGLLIIDPVVHGDPRGFFVETYARDRYVEAGITEPFVQDNLSSSPRGVLRGLHLQHPRAQGKLCSVVDGEVFDVAVDVRVGSPSFGRHVARVLDSETKNQLFIPKGFAHGFCVIGDAPATFAYKCSDRYAPDHEVTVRWDDPAIGIDWPVDAPALSAKDEAGALLADIPEDRLPRFGA